MKVKALITFSYGSAIANCFTAGGIYDLDQKLVKQINKAVGTRTVSELSKNGKVKSVEIKEVLVKATKAEVEAYDADTPAVEETAEEEEVVEETTEEAPAEEEEVVEETTEEAPAEEEVVEETTEEAPAEEEATDK